MSPCRHEVDGSTASWTKLSGEDAIWRGLEQLAPAQMTQDLVESAQTQAIMAEEQPANTTDPGVQDDLWSRYVEEVRAGTPDPFHDQWARYQQIFSGRREEDGPPLAWRPSEAQIAGSNLGALMAELGIDSYPQLHDWSVNDRGAFWRRVIERLGIVFGKEPTAAFGSTDVKHPDWLPGAEMNCVDSCFTASPNKTAIVSGREGSDELDSISYAELERLVNRVANGLREREFRVGDAIALYMPMTVECVAAYLGIVQAGCRVVSIADSFSPTEVKRRMEIGGARSIVSVTSFSRAGKTIDLYGKLKAAEAPHAILIPPVSEDVRLRDGDIVWDDFLSPDETFESAVGDPYRVINILFSSGTTADPKAIPWTHLTSIKCAMDGHYHQDIQADDVVAWPTNIGWMMGPWLIYATMINGATMALYEGMPTGDGFTRFVRDARVTVLGTVPSLVRAWRSADAVPDDTWNHVRLFSSTGEPSNREDYLWLMSRTGYRAPVIEYCGGTEIGGGYLTGTVVQPAAPATFTTPALGLDVVILDEDGSPVGEGGEGELFLIPPSIGLSETLLNKNHDEVYYDGCPSGPTGEVLRRHGDQMVRLRKRFYKAHGRADDTMNLSGIKISSRELETVLDGHELVYESAAVAVQPQGEGAEVLVVYAVTEGDVDPHKLKQELAAMIAGRINPLFKIHDLVITDSLPRTASNKLMRRQLRDRYDSRQ